MALQSNQDRGSRGQAETENGGQCGHGPNSGFTPRQSLGKSELGLYSQVLFGEQ